jgi:hypothetical protein
MPPSITSIAEADSITPKPREEAKIMEDAKSSVALVNSIS